MKTNGKYQVIVIGAGPSGSSAAYDLGKGGIDTLIIEKEEMPREKLCGGAFSEVARSYLRFDVPQEYNDWDCYGARVSYKDSSIFYRKKNRIATLVTRKTFDKYLLDKALEHDVSLIYDKAINISIDSSFATVKTVKNKVYKAHIVIIASGSRSNLIKYVRKHDSLNQIGFCVEQSYPVMTPDPYVDLEGLIDIYFGIGRSGYGWIFHHGSYYSIGIGGIASLMDDPRKTMSLFWEKRGFPLKDLQPKGAFIPCGGVRRKLVDNNIILAGDSAGFVDPFYGEGIAYAIKSGQLSAKIAIEALKRNVFSKNFLIKYEVACESAFNNNLFYSYYMTILFHKFPNIFINSIASNEKVLSKYLEIPMGKLTYSSYIKWLLFHKLRIK